MAKETKNEVATIPGPDDGGYLILSEPGIIEQVHGMSPTVSDLAKLVVPSGTGAKGFAYETADGQKFAEKLEVIIALATPVERQFYATGVDDGNAGPPHCSSADGRTGTGVRDVEVILECAGDPDAMDALARTEQVCGECPFSQFGSDLTGKRSQACKERVRLLAFVPELVLPFVIHIPPASIKNWKQYGFTLMSSMRHVSAVVTEVSLEKISGSPDYYVMKFRAVRKLSEPESVKLREFASGMSLAY